MPAGGAAAAGAAPGRLHAERFGAAWQQLGCGPAPGLTDLHARLLSAYAEPHRHYHTGRHLAECLDLLDAVATLARRPAEIELGLWFHDAIYDPRRPDNEERSAGWAREAALVAGADRATAERLAALVLATRHDAPPPDDDARLLVDVDLSILGALPARFAEYEDQIRAEYKWVPEPVYRRERRRILERFLARPRIFSTRPLADRLEDRARRNLQAAIARLQD